MLASSQVVATPKNVIIIRHAEKIPGENHLDLKGFERAAALAYYFSGNPIYNNPPITHIFAAGLQSADSSLRPIQTCTPIANHYKLPIVIDFTEKDNQGIAKEILTNSLYDQKTVLICWSHGEIASLVKALGGDDPGWWGPNIFDQVYFMTFQQKSKPKLQKILQKLMYGDRTTFNDNSPPLPEHTKFRVDEDR